MELQRFVGKDTKSVMDEIRTTLGDHALIVSNTRVGSKTEIIAAREEQKVKSDVEVRADSASSKQQDEKKNFSQTMADQQFSSPRFADNDPWEHIQKINKEISSIKSALQENPGLVYEKTPQEIADSSISVLDPRSNIDKSLEILNGTKTGCCVVWGERKSGKSFLVKELIKRRAHDHEHTMLLRLSHDTSSDDSHLCQIAKRFSLNVIFINDMASIENIIGAFGNECLVLIEADLAMLANLALDSEAAWLKKSSNFIIDEDEEQTELVCKLFKQIDAKIPKRISSKILEDVI